MPNEMIAIYDPPKQGWPYIVVVQRAAEYEMIAVRTRKEARELAVARCHALKHQVAIDNKSAAQFGALVLEPQR
jgi:hypothetical protein